MGRFDVFPIFIATFASRRVTMIATRSNAQKQTRLPIRYLYFNLSLKPLINKEVIKVFQNYNKFYKRYKIYSDYFRRDFERSRAGVSRTPRSRAVWKIASVVWRWSLSRRAAATLSGKRRAYSGVYQMKQAG